MLNWDYILRRGGENMTKRITSLVLAILLLFTGSVAVSAATGEETVQPLYDYTSSTSVNLSVSNDTAYCTAQLIGYASTTKIVITMTLQKKTLLWWSEVDSWTTTYNDNVAMMSKSCSVGSGKYRVKSKFVVYCGSDSETITSYSLEREYS